MPKILVIDDDPMILKLIKQHLSAKNYDVITSTNGKDGIKTAISEWKYLNLIIMDFQMNDINGIEALQKIKKNQKTYAIPVIMLTGIIDENIMSSAMKNYAVLFLNKPIDMYDLESKIISILE